MTRVSRLLETVLDLVERMKKAEKKIGKGDQLFDESHDGFLERLEHQCNDLECRVKELERIHRPVCPDCGRIQIHSGELGHELKGHCCKENK